MTARPFMPLYVGDYLTDTLHLTTEQHGAYLLILMAMWRRDARLPNDPAKLARIAGVSPKRWPSVWGEISDFFTVDGADITNPRLLKEFQKADSISQERRNAGRLGVAAKALKNNKPTEANGQANDKLSQLQLQKEEEGACAREAFFDRLRRAANVESLTPYWTGESLAKAVERWQAMGLTEEQILNAAAESRKKNPTQPDGPKALDRWMEATAKAGADTPTKAKEPRHGRTVTTDLTVEERAEFWAGQIAEGKYVPASAVTPTMARVMLGRGLVSQEQLRERGIAA